jgi:hypothetical protein
MGIGVNYVDFISFELTRQDQQPLLNLFVLLEKNGKYRDDLMFLQKRTTCFSKEWNVFQQLFPVLQSYLSHEEYRYLVSSSSNWLSLKRETAYFNLNYKCSEKYMTE